MAWERRQRGAPGFTVGGTCGHLPNERAIIPTSLARYAHPGARQSGFKTPLVTRKMGETAASHQLEEPLGHIMIVAPTRHMAIPIQS